MFTQVYCHFCTVKSQHLLCKLIPSSFWVLLCLYNVNCFIWRFLLTLEEAIILFAVVSERTKIHVSISLSSFYRCTVVVTFTLMDKNGMTVLGFQWFKCYFSRADRLYNIFLKKDFGEHFIFLVLPSQK